MLAPALASLSSAITAALGDVHLSAIVPPAAVSGPPPAPPEYSLGLAQVASYSKNVYAALLNGVAVTNAGVDSAGGAVARENLLGPFYAPPAPAGTAAGIPYAPGANHNDYAAQVAASLRSLAGNGTLFGQ